MRLLVLLSIALAGALVCSAPWIAAMVVGAVLVPSLWWSLGSFVGGAIFGLWGAGWALDRWWL